MIDPGSVVFSWLTVPATAGSSREIIAVNVGTTAVVRPERPVAVSLTTKALSVRIPKRGQRETGEALTA